MICLSRFWAYCFLFTVVLADSGVAAAVGIVSCLSFFFFFMKMILVMEVVVTF